jgi:hypothetical protein
LIQLLNPIEKAATTCRDDGSPPPWLPTSLSVAPSFVRANLSFVTAWKSEAGLPNLGQLGVFPIWRILHRAVHLIKPPPGARHPSLTLA